MKKNQLQKVHDDQSRSVEGKEMGTNHFGFVRLKISWEGAAPPLLPLAL
jgi:hypothetical protein